MSPFQHISSTLWRTSTPPTPPGSSLPGSKNPPSCSHDQKLVGGTSPIHLPPASPLPGASGWADWDAQSPVRFFPKNNRIGGTSSLVEKSLLMTLPPPPLGWFGLFWIWEKNDFWWPPPPWPKLGKIWNVDYFDIVAPPLTLAKTIPKSYQTDTWGLFYSYKGHICTKCCIYLTNTSPIYHKNQGPISVIWIWEKTEKFRPTLSQS